jgi:hypothetical protein
MAWTKTDLASVLSILERHEALGLHVDDRLWREVRQPGEMFLGVLAPKEEFLKLVWQSINETHLLAPPGQPRTLRDCALRLSRFEWEFEAVVQKWFQPCADIDAAFDYGKVGLLALTPLTEPEKRETPEGNYYIYDGVHKSIVLAKRLLRGEAEYKPVRVLLLTPRRS